MGETEKHNPLHDIQQGEKQKYWVICHTMNFGQLVDPLWFSHLNCLKCERRTVKVLRGKSTGDLTTLSLIDPRVRLSNPAPLSLSCLQHPSSQHPHPPSLANSVLSKPSIKTPAWPRPLFLRLAAHKPQAAPRDQTARLGPWLRLSIGSYGNGCLSPNCLIG